MVIEYCILPFNPKEETTEMVDKFIDYQQDVFREENPDDPLPQKEIRMQTLLNSNPMLDLYRWIVVDSQENIIGGSVISVFNSNYPEYEQNKHAAMVNASVLKPFRNQGIGTELAKTMEKKLKELDKRQLQSLTSEASGKRFLEKYGAMLALETAENRLYLDEVDWVMLEEWVKEGPERAPNVKIVNFTDVPDELIDDFVEIYTETMKQQGSNDLGMDVRVTPESRRKQEELIKMRGYEWVTKATLEEDGKISGLTEIFINSKTPHRIDQNLTGVRHEYRGKGLGKWLKAEMLLDIKRTFPDLKYISTANTDTDATMASINSRIGFREYKSSNAYHLTYEDLANKLTT